MRTIIAILIIMGSFIITNHAQDIRLDLGSDLHLNCFDEITLYPKILNWSRKTLTYYNDFYSVQFFGDSIGYVWGKGYGSEEYSFKTLNGGKSWQRIIYPIPGLYVGTSYFLNKDTGYIIGRDAFSFDQTMSIYRTYNGGNTWDSLSNMGYGVTSFFMLDSNSFFASTSAYLKRSDDAGYSWVKVNENQIGYDNIVFIDSLHAFAINVNRNLIKSNDKGVTWANVDLGDNNGLSKIKVMGSHIWLTGPHGTIFKSIDYGESWKRLNTGYTFGFQDIEMSDTNNITVVGTNGTIISSKDGGSHWTREWIEFTDVLFALAIVNKDKKFAVGQSGSFYTYHAISDKIACNWDPKEYLSDTLSDHVKIKPLKDITYTVSLEDSSGIIAYDTLNVFVREPYSYIIVDSSSSSPETIQLHTTVELGNWHVLSEGSDEWHNGVYFTSNDTGFAAGNNIIKTTDGGKTWQNKTPKVTCSFSSIQFVNKMVGFAANGCGMIFKTIDGGETWDPLNTNYDNLIESISFVNEKIGFAAGFDGTVLKTTDGGETWDKSMVGPGNRISKIYFLNAQQGFLLMDLIWERAYYYTENGGSSWNKRSFGTSSIGMTDIFFVNEDIGYMIGGVISDFLFMKTIDGGKTWKTTIYPRYTSTTYTSVYFTDENTGFVSNLVGEILKTSDGGETWYIMETLMHYSSGYSLNSLYFSSKRTGFVVGEAGLIAKYNEPDDIAYSWNPADNVNPPNASSPVINYKSPGTYFVEITNSIGCRSNSSINIDEITGINNTIELKSGLTIFPNPACDYINIKLQSTSEIIESIEMFDLNGKLVLSKVPDNIGNSYSLKLNGLVKGFYVIRISGIRAKYYAKINIHNK